MAGKVKGGLGKTARSSTIFNRKEALTGHSCENCAMPIKVKELLVVKVLTTGATLFYHNDCYKPISPPGKGTSEHTEGGAVKKKQTAWIPNCFVGRRGWQNKSAGHRGGYDKAYGYGHLAP